MHGYLFCLGDYRPQYEIHFLYTTQVKYERSRDLHKKYLTYKTIERLNLQWLALFTRRIVLVKGNILLYDDSSVDFYSFLAQASASCLGVASKNFE